MIRGIAVDSIAPGSIAGEVGIEAGDEVISINGEVPEDILDWRFAESNEEIILLIRHRDGREVEYEIEKDYDESLGIHFESPTLAPIRSCRNSCLFCFIDQMPKKMRKSLYIKDDDYRLSFLTGSYITLTNLRQKDIDRIEKLHISPLYVSVHTTNPALRQKMMNNPGAGEVFGVLKGLAAKGIEFHTQVVLCPGLNDGPELDKTIADLFSLYPGVRSLAVVPAGLTGHRENLYPLAAFDRESAGEVLSRIRDWQVKCRRERGTRFVYAADEFFVQAARPIPDDEDYEEYSQLENGVGLIRSLYNEWEGWTDYLPRAVPRPVQAVIATGRSAYHCLKPIAEQLNRIEGVIIDLAAVDNRYFGGHVTVTGLLTYSDLNRGLKEMARGKIVYLPTVLFKEGTELFLDGFTKDDLAASLGADIRAVRGLSHMIRDLTADAPSEVK